MFWNLTLINKVAFKMMERIVAVKVNKTFFFHFKQKKKKMIDSLSQKTFLALTMELFLAKRKSISILY